MATHDYVIANQGFPAFRADLNDALAAIVSNNSSATEPTTMFAHMVWVDTAANPSILKIRNADNDAWITIGALDQTDDTFILRPAAGSVSAPAYSTTGDTNTGIFFPAADTIAFAEGGAEAMRINSSGNLGIQVVPKAFNTVDGAAQVGTNFTITSFNNDSGTGYNHYYSSGWKYTNAGVASRFSSTSTIPFLWQYVASGSADGSIDWSEAMRIDSSGNLLVGTTSALSTERMRVYTSTQSWVMVVQNDRNVSGDLGAYVSLGSNTNDTTSYFMQGVTAGVGAKIELRGNGGIANFSGNNVNLSDRREKTNFAPAGEYLSKICAIPVQTFNYIDQNHEEDPGLTLGVVAQDVQEVAPELVMESNWGTKEEPKMRLSIYQTDLQYALMKSIQELKAELDTVKAELAILKGN
jgi:hypothetical protein